MPRVVVAAVLLLCWGAAPARGQQPDPRQVFPLSEVYPGQRATAHTVLQGTVPDTFGLEVIAVVESGDPRAHVILVRVLDERLAEIGVALGMSGSPVYVADGRLLGALAFAFVGATEPLGGVTPFEEMVANLGEALAEPAGEQAASAWGAQGASVPQLPFPEWRAAWAAGRLTPPAPERVASGLPAGLQQLELPLSLSGPLGAEALGPPGFWAGLGLRPVPAGVGIGVAGAAVGGEGSSEEPAGLRPGEAFAITLIGGDMIAAAIGTVTWVEGDRLLGLGHPFLHTAPVAVPLARARIHTVIPTRSVAFKVGSPLEEVGAVLADRRTGIAARLGARAPRIPLEVTLRWAPEQEEPESYRFTVMRQAILSPGLLSTALEATLTGRLFRLGVATLASRLCVHLEDGRTLERRDLFQTLGPGQTAAAEVMAPIGYLAATSLAPFSVDSVAVELTLYPEIRAASIQEIRVPHRAVRPGEQLSVEVRLRHHLKGEEVRQVTLQVPAEVRGDRLLLTTGSAATYFAWDQERAPLKYVPRSFDDLVRLLETYPSDESLIVRLYGPSRGVVHEGREISSLPLSKWRVLRETSSSGKTMPVAGTILAEERVATGAVILGGTSLELEVLR